MAISERGECAVRLMETRGIGPARIQDILAWVEREGLSLSSLLQSEEGLRSVLTEKQVEAFHESEGKASETLKRLRDHGVTVIVRGDSDYPPSLEDLGRQAAPVLFLRGSTGVLSKPGVGFCGSRKASQESLKVAKDCATQLADRGVNAVSGYAAGVDTVTHSVALRAGGTTTVVLPYGILHFQKKQDVEREWDWQRVAVVSQFLPGLPWNARNAMRRNGTICGLSRAMIVIEAGPKSGSLAAGKECLKINRSVFAVVQDGRAEREGNRELLKRGAFPLKWRRDMNHADLKDVLRIVEGQLPSGVQLDLLR